MPSIHNGTADDSGSVLLQVGGMYALSCDTAGSASAAIKQRIGESGTYKSVLKDGAAIALTGTGEVVNAAFAAGTYLQATVTGAGGVSYEISANGIDMMG